MDKDLTKRMVAGKVLTPKWDVVTVTEENLPQLMQTTQLPVVVKPIASAMLIHFSISKPHTLGKTALKTGYSG